MTCDIVPIPSSACSGKCKGNCKNSPGIWIVAACEGMISLYEKNGEGAIVAKPHNNNMVFASMAQFQQFLMGAEESRAFEQLILVGGGNDIAWLHASITPKASRYITAEIQYPLIPGWFKEQDVPHLTHAMKNIFQ